MFIRIDNIIYNAENILKIELDGANIIIYYNDSSKTTHTFSSELVARTVFENINY